MKIYNWVLVFLIVLLVIFTISNRDEKTIEQTENEKIAIEIKKTQISAPKQINLYNHKKKMIEIMDIEDYVIGVIAAEMPVSFDMEALKAQAVAARTLAVYKIQKSSCDKSSNAHVCSDSRHCQAWLSVDELKKNWGSKFDEKYSRLKKSVNDTKGVIMIWKDEPIQVFFYSTSNGWTEEASAAFSNSLPYYKVVASPGEENAPRYNGSVTMSAQKFITIFKKRYPNTKLNTSNLRSSIKIVGRTPGNRVEDIKIDGVTVKGKDFRFMYGLNSADFNIFIDGDTVNIITIGFGHGVGMSQVGADAMGRSGSDYQEILTHYYRGVDIVNTND